MSKEQFKNKTKELLKTGMKTGWVKIAQWAGGGGAIFMFLKKLVLILALALGVSTTIYADDNLKVEILPKGEVFPKVEASLKAAYPKLTYREVYATEIKGLYGVVMDSGLMYYFPDGDYLMFGEIWNKQGKNITAGKKEEITTARIGDLPLDKAIKVGNGKNIVIEFSDPDCPFCRQAAKWLNGRDDITRYVFLFPIEQLHPDAINKSKNILCSDNQAKAYEDAINGSLDSKDYKVCEDKNILEVLSIHQQAGTKIGVTGTPSFFVNGEFVAGANTTKIAQLLNQQKGGDK